MLTDTHLVGTEGVWKHVAAACSQHVHLLTHIVLQLLKLALRPSDLGLDLKNRQWDASFISLVSTSTWCTQTSVLLPCGTSPAAYMCLGRVPGRRPSSRAEPLCTRCAPSPCEWPSAACRRWRAAWTSPLPGAGGAVAGKVPSYGKRSTELMTFLKMRKTFSIMYHGQVRLCTRINNTHVFSLSLFICSHYCNAITLECTLTRDHWLGISCCWPLLGGGAQGLAGGIHHVASLCAIVFRLETQEQAELVLLLRQTWGKRSKALMYTKETHLDSLIPRPC